MGPPPFCNFVKRQGDEWSAQHIWVCWSLTEARMCSERQPESSQPPHTSSAGVRSTVSQLAIHMALQMVSSLFLSSAAEVIHGGPVS